MPKLSQVPADSRRSSPGASESVIQHPRASGPGTLFGVPVGDLGWFSTLLMSLATGFAAFFAATFFGIMGILLYNTTGHHTVDFALSYRRFGLPVGITVAMVAFAYLGSLWMRRQLRRS